MTVEDGGGGPLEGGAPPLARERAEHRQLLREVVAGAREAEGAMAALATRARAMDQEQGIGFLRVKAGMLAEYNANLAYLLLRRTRGASIEGESAVERLCYLRTLLEKVRPIEHKLKFQIDKHVRMAETGQDSSNDPAKFKANPDLLASKLGDSDDEDDDDEEEEEASKAKTGQKYVAPKNVPQHFEESKSKEEQVAEAEAKRRKSALSHSMMRELKQQMFDTPEEISHEQDTKKAKYIQQERERAMYEEDMFTRLPVTKADRMAKKQMATSASLGASLTSFGRSTFGEEGEVARKRKSKGDKGGKKKKFKRKKKN